MKIPSSPHPGRGYDTQCASTDYEIFSCHVLGTTRTLLQADLRPLRPSFPLLLWRADRPRLIPRHPAKRFSSAVWAYSGSHSLFSKVSQVGRGLVAASVVCNIFFGLPAFE
jgi:hypothetical protein